MTSAWEDRGLLGTWRPARALPGAEALRRALSGVSSPADVFTALGWRPRHDADDVVRRATAWPPPARAGDARWTLETDGRRVRLGAPGAALRGATVDLPRALAAGGVDLALVAALLGPDGSGRARLARERGALEPTVLRAARRALDEVFTRLVDEGLAPAAALGRARALVAARLAVDERLRLLGPAALGRAHQAHLAVAVERGALVRAPRAARRAQGSWFTPPPLASAVAELGLRPVVRRALASAVDPLAALASLRVVDPACGSGRVLTAALDVLVRAALASGDGPPPALVELRRRLAPTLAGADVDADALGLARAALALHVGAPADASLSLVVGDALTLDWAGRFPGGFDAVLGNPPWHRELAGRDLLRGARAAQVGEHARARGDLWMLFAHLALDLLRPAGVHAFVAPAYWLRGAGPGPRHLRERLRERTRWRALADLARLEGFEAGGVSARAVIYAVEAGRVDEADDEQRVDAWTVPPGASPLALATALRRDAPADGITRARVGQQDVHGPRGEVLLERVSARGETTRALLARLQGGALPASWLLSEGITANPERLTRSLAARSRALASFAGEPVFVLPRGHAVLRRLPARERALLVPWLAPDAIQRLRAGDGPPAAQLIYATAATLTRERAAPRLTAHLARFRPLLDARRETRLGRRAWFHLHWPRDPRVVRGARVLVPRWTRWPSGALALERCAVGESAWVLVPPAPAWAPLAAALTNSLPFALGVLLVSKHRGKGVDVSRAALAGCPWPDDATFAAAVRDPTRPLARCAAAARELATAHREATRRFDGPWWTHPEGRVRAVGRRLDEAACRLVGVSYAETRALADALLAPTVEVSSSLPAPGPVSGPLVVSREPAWSDDGLGADCLHLLVARAHVAGLRALLDPFVDVLEEGPRALLRLDPTVDSPTLAALLRRAGWTIDDGAEDATVWAARPGRTGAHASRLVRP